MAFEREGVLLLARDDPLLCNVLCRHTHVISMGRVGEAIVCEAVEQHGVARLLTTTHLRSEKWRARHILRTASEIEMPIAGDEAMHCTHNSLHPTAAHPVDSLCRHISRQTCPEPNLPRRIHALASLKHIANDYVRYVDNIEFSKRSRCRGNPKVDGRDIFEVPHK
jgi:hypothetical protein